MNKQEIIKEIKHRLELYKTIKPEEFNFRWFITSYDFDADCGAICCLWGWEPKLTGVVKWEEATYNSVKITISAYPHVVLGWGGSIVDYLYFDSSDNYTSVEIAEITGIELESYSTLPEVLSAWEKVIELLETGDSLDEYLNLG